jgi:anhydro-N-acetylmuramic acid kinase
MIAIGLMSGTSLDGIDGVVVDFSSGVSVCAFVHHGFTPALRDLLFRLQSPSADELAASRMAGVELARAYAAVVAELLSQASLSPSEVSAIGAHGQTVRHAPERGYTIQLLEPALLAALSGVDVVSDFRAADIAHGGQGAPLVPAFHAAIFASSSPRAVCNIGGIANVTVLKAGQVTGFDTGPGNCLMDYWISRHRGPAFDANGAWAASGRVLEPLLTRLNAEPYLSAPPPKSTGRDLFNPAWLEAKLDPSDAPQDVQATLCEFTAQSIARAIDAPELLLCGGGAMNLELCRRLDARLGYASKTTADFGVPVDQVEAIAFAWLARAYLQGEPANMPAVTGARRACVLGSLAKA